MGIRLQHKLGSLGLLGRDDRQPAMLTERDLCLLLEAQHFGVEAQATPPSAPSLCPLAAQTAAAIRNQPSRRPMGDEPRPCWDKALDPLRHEESMFRVLLVVIAIAAVIVLVVLVARAV